MHLNQYFSAFTLKCIAMVAMTLDHVAWLFLDNDSWLAESLHFVGRLVMPLMAYFLVVGFYHSKNHHMYLKRLFIFALISQPIFYLFIVGIENIITMPIDISQLFYGNVLFTLFFALAILLIYHSKIIYWQKFLAIIVLLILAKSCDYGIGLVALVMFFDYFYPKNKSNHMLMAYLLILPIIYVLIYGFNKTQGLGFMHYGMLLSALLIYSYNGDKGLNIGGRYLFYAFYPIHLLIIGCLYWIIA